MAKGIAWITTSWIGKLPNAMTHLRPLEEAGLEVRLHPLGRDLTEAEVLAGLDGVVAVVPSNDPYNERVLSRAKDLRIIARTGVGLNAIDIDAATARGVVVTNAPGRNADSVAEHAIGLILAAAKDIPRCNRLVHEGEWGSLRRSFAPLRGKTLGVIGVGNIGKRVARLAKAFGMEVVGNDLVRDERFAAQTGLYYKSLDEVARQADFLTVHVPLTPDTRGMVSRALLGLMKPTAYLVNTSRGPVVDLDALADTLSGGKLRGAALDVMPSEPPDVSHPIFGFENVVLTPHIAGLGEDACENCLRHAVGCVLDILAGRRPDDGLVNPDVLAKAGIKD